MMAMPARHLGPWTEQDILAFPNDGQRYEIVEGRLLVSPSPGIRHQRASGRLYRWLDDSAPAHLEAIEGIGIRIPGSNYLVPDVLVVDKAAGDANSLDPHLVQLVIEVVSPGSIFMDKGTKPLIYAGAGIQNFWRVELEKPSVFVYRLVGDSYEEVAKAQAGERLTVMDPFQISFDPVELVS